MKSSPSACSTDSASDLPRPQPASPASAEERANTTSHTDEASGSSWGLPSTGLSAALYSGFGGLALTDDPEVSSSRKDHRYQDEQWEQSAREVEDAAARAAAAVSSFFGGGGGVATETEDVTAIGDNNALDTNANEDAGGGEWGEEPEVDGEDLIDETARMAATVASSFFSGASTFLAGSNMAFPVADESNNSGTHDGAVDDGNKNQTEQEPDALRAILDLNPLNSIASHWIDDLEQRSALADPHHRLRRHLDDHIGDWPASTYEEWVEEALVGLDGWDRDSAVVDDTFYREGSVHRNLWNERMTTEDEGAGGNGENTTDGKARDRNKRYVLPRKPPVAGASVPKATVAIARNETVAPKERVAATSSAPTSVDADLDNLISEGGMEEVQTIPTAATVPKSSNDDTDLNELLVEEEAVFVSPPNSGGFQRL